MTADPSVLPEAEAVAEKAFDPLRSGVPQRSVVQESQVQGGIPGETAGDYGSLLWIGQQADGISPWGFRPTFRDRQLRGFLTQESMLISAVGSIAARNAGMEWSLTGPEAARNRMAEVLHGANMGEGWEAFMVEVTIELLTQDKGAFIEIIRMADSPMAEVVGVQVLDSARCWHTGKLEAPVIYQDVNGRWHELKWYQVATIAEMPVPHETLYGLQYSAVTRALRAAQLWKNIATYMEEKTAGTMTRAIIIVNGISKSELAQAMTLKQATDDALLRQRFTSVPVVTTMDPNARPQVAVVEQATLPDGFDKGIEFQHYLTALSLAFLVDFQEFAPLPGGNLGTSTQSEVLHAKARAKGTALHRRIIENLMNQWIMPRSVTFAFDVEDPELESIRSENMKNRQEAVATMIASRVIDPIAGQQLALDFGDIPQAIFEELQTRGVGMGQDVTGENPQPGQARTSTNAADGRTDEGEQIGARARETVQEQGRESAEGEVAEFINGGLRQLFGEVRRELERIGV